MSFSPQLFLSNVKAKDGLAKPCRYEVILPIPTYINNFIESSFLEKLLNFPNSILTDITQDINGLINGNTDEQSKTSSPSISRYLALQCESAELPGKTLLTQDVKIYGPTFKVPYQTQYQETTLTFMCTNEFYERKLFDRWLEAIMPTDTNNLRYAKEEETRYMTNIQIVQYDEFIKKIFVIELIDAFPIGISSQPLSWSEEGFHRVSVQFTYQKYRVVYSGSYDLAAAAAALFGAKAAPFFNRVGQSISNTFVNPIARVLL
jgi:hypothetical protein